MVCDVTRNFVVADAISLEQFSREVLNLTLEEKFSNAVDLNF